jgi:hypothetical protein
MNARPRRRSRHGQAEHDRGVTIDAADDVCSPDAHVAIAAELRAARAARARLARRLRGACVAPELRLRCACAAP